MVSTGDVDGPTSDAVALASRLAQSQQVRGCLSRSWFRSRFRRQERGGDERVIAAMTEALQRDGDRLSSLATALAQQDALFFAHFQSPETP
ncbi:MAG: DUF1585 domain-containing protein [Myxococcaceae bacterium]|nr:DUF1585 domain-containing protein [Myxococcaceae bacterium]